jgi:hypothetical protein
MTNLCETPRPLTWRLSFQSYNDISFNLLFFLHYVRFKGGGWLDNSNWNSNESYNVWYGLTVDKTGIVTSIDLYDNNLQGIDFTIGTTIIFNLMTLQEQFHHLLVV